MANSGALSVLLRMVGLHRGTKFVSDIADPVQGCLHVRRILRGHGLDLYYRILGANVLAARQFLHKHRSPDPERH